MASGSIQRNEAMAVAIQRERGERGAALEGDDRAERVGQFRKQMLSRSKARRPSQRPAGGAWKPSVAGFAKPNHEIEPVRDIDKLDRLLPNPVEFRERHGEITTAHGSSAAGPALERVDRMPSCQHEQTLPRIQPEMLSLLWTEGAEAACRPA